MKKDQNFGQFCKFLREKYLNKENKKQECEETDLYKTLIELTKATKRIKEFSVAYMKIVYMENIYSLKKWKQIYSKYLKRINRQKEKINHSIKPRKDNNEMYIDVLKRFSIISFKQDISERNNITLKLIKCFNSEIENLYDKFQKSEKQIQNQDLNPKPTSQYTDFNEYQEDHSQPKKIDKGMEVHEHNEESTRSSQADSSQIEERYDDTDYFNTENYPIQILYEEEEKKKLENTDITINPETDQKSLDKPIITQISTFPKSLQLKNSFVDTNFILDSNSKKKEEDYHYLYQSGAHGLVNSQIRLQGEKIVVLVVTQSTQEAIFKLNIGKKKVWEVVWSNGFVTQYIGSDSASQFIFNSISEHGWYYSSFNCSLFPSIKSLPDYQDNNAEEQRIEDFDLNLLRSNETSYALSNPSQKFDGIDEMFWF